MKLTTDPVWAAFDPENTALIAKGELAIYLESQALWIAVLPVAVLTLALDFSGAISTAPPRVIGFALLAGLLIRSRPKYVYGQPTLPAPMRLCQQSNRPCRLSLLSSWGHWGAMIIGLIATTAGLVLLQTKVGWQNYN